MLVPTRQVSLISFYTLPVTDIDASLSPSQSTTKRQATRKPSSAIGKYQYALHQE